MKDFSNQAWWILLNHNVRVFGENAIVKKLNISETTIRLVLTNKFDKNEKHIKQRVEDILIPLGLPCPIYKNISNEDCLVMQKDKKYQQHQHVCKICCFAKHRDEDK